MADAKAADAADAKAADAEGVDEKAVSERATDQQAVDVKMEKRDMDALATLDPKYRALEQQQRANDWGERYPAATDWLRRDARELTWREQERKRWAGEDSKGLDGFLTSVGLDATPAGEEDWRVDEFRELIEREKGFRTKVYKWWLGVWDASGDDYLYDDDYKRQRDFEQGFESARQEVIDRWQDRDSGPPYDRPPYPRRRLSAGRGYGRGYGRYDDDDDEYDDDEYGRGAYGGGRERQRRLARASDDDDDDGRWQRGSRARSSSRYDDDEEEEEEAYGGRREWRAAAKGRAKGQKNEAPAVEVETPKRRSLLGFRTEPAKEVKEAEEAAAAAEEEEEEERSPPRARSSERVRGGEVGSRAEYVAKRLKRLEAKVGERVAELEEEEDEVEASRRQAKAELRELKSQISASGEIASAFRELEAELAVETKGPRARKRECQKLCDELYSRLTEVWANLDEAEGRLAEIRDARRALDRRGLTGLRVMLDNRRMSRGLRTFLEKVM